MNALTVVECAGEKGVMLTIIIKIYSKRTVTQIL